ncbi:hypothetical protein AB0283_16070 [Micromonospora vinacea]|uniref:hypothetical protein n=1 Tax=Micromonospora vinacea TaxID=709878 RepID=UPI00344FF0DF
MHDGSRAPITEASLPSIRRAFHGGSMKRRSVLAASVLSAALVVSAAPAPAQAADVLEVNSAYGSSAGDRGRLFVSITSTQPVAEIRAEIVNEYGVLIAQTSDFVVDSQTPEATIWATPTPLIFDELGDHPVHVEVTDTAGNHVRRDWAGWLNYLVATSLEDVTIDRSTIDYDHRQVTARGVLKGRWPGTGEIRPLADVPVDINAGNGSPPVYTAADGSFTGTVTLYAYGTEVMVQYPGSYGELGFEQSEPVRFQLPIVPRQTRVTATVDRTRVVAGETVRVSGRLSWRTPSGWAPLPNQVFAIHFVLCDDNGCYNQYGPVNTDAKGRFKLDLLPSHTGFLHTSYSPLDPFIGESATQTPVVTVVPADARR